MNRFEYIEARLHETENFVSNARSVKIYDGDQKTKFEDGEVVLTTHRLFWGEPGEISRAATTLCLALGYIVSITEETASSNFFGRKTRLILHLRPPAPHKTPGPLDSSTATYIKLSGKNGLSVEFITAFRETVNARIWEVIVLPNIRTPEAGASGSSGISDAHARLKMRTGIGGIERTIEAKAKETDENIQIAFQDLNVLMGMAKDMVALSKEISAKIREHKGDISDDETVRFKSYLMSMGIDDPVTRDCFASDNEYYRSLAKEICELLLDPIEESAGMMSMADVYCRVNRARGMELVSPKDLLNACRLLDGPLTLRKFPSGAMVLQLESHSDEIVSVETLEQVQDAGSLGVEELAQRLKISLLLAKERMLAAERLGKLCRDESVQGLKFYPNLMLQRWEES